VTQAPIALTMGDPAGVGGELTLAAWRDRADDFPVFFALDDPARLTELARRIGIAAPIREIAGPEGAAAIFPDALPVLPVPLAAVSVPGRPDPANGKAVLSSIDQAVALVQAGRAAAMVTNPIQKSTLYETGFSHPGHTEYLADLAGLADRPVMMLEGGGLRVALVTIHLALKDVPQRLSRDAIVHTGKVTAAALRRDFGVARPRLAVAALNPHAGERGSIGREEIEIVAPAVADLRAAGIDVTGPHPSDTLFHAGARAA
jgi:4-hydroxythreonine-4-phosphate dehydrogenase